MSEIYFEVREDDADGGYVANAIGHAIVNQGEKLEELRAMFPGPIWQRLCGLWATIRCA